MALPTPCAAWDVRALLAHLIGGNLRWAALAQGEPLRREPARGEGPSPDLLGDDPAGAYRRSATLLAEAWQDPALLDQSFELPVGVMEGRAALGAHLVETVAHAWNLARATGQQLAFDPDVVGAAARFAHSRVPRERPPGAPVAPPVPMADDLPAIERFAAYLGRTL